MKEKKRKSKKSQKTDNSKKKQAKPAKKQPKDKSDTGISAVKKEVESQLKPVHKKQILEQRKAITDRLDKVKFKKDHKPDEWIQTGVPGFDDLLEEGIPKGTSILVCGGPGSGKTIFCLQTLAYAASKGEKCLYMTFEESEERLKAHMRDFGWNPDELIKKGKLMIKRYDPFEVTRQVEAMLEKAKGELMIDIEPVIFPEGFRPDRIAVDSLSAIAAAFVGKEETYRIYIEQLFRLLEKVHATSFLIAESADAPLKLTASGVEEFLADGVIVMYNIRKANVRESAVEILKVRGAKFRKRIVAMQIESGKGIVVYPEQEVFG